LAAAVALLTFAFLVAVVAVVWSFFVKDPVHVPGRHWMTTTRMLIVVTLVFVIPLVVYYTLKLWIEGDASPYFDIEFAWKAGMQALSDNGMQIESIPIFLIFGSIDLDREQSIVDATHQGFRVRGVPEGPAPLHWYANPDAIYIFCSDIGCSSAVASWLEKQSHLRNPDGDVRAVDDSGQNSSSSDDDMSVQDHAVEDELREVVQSHATSAIASAKYSDQSIVLAAGESARQLERLRFLCHLLRRSRRPFCPINGILCLMPFNVLRSSPRAVGEFAKAYRIDLAELQTSLQFRCPTSALVVGLEQEAGFRELVRRYGREEATSGVFGKPYDLRNTATADQLDVFTDHVVGVFEDSVYTLFRDESALARPGNTHLFSLLCKIRFESKSRLMELLVRGFGVESSPVRSAEAGVMFGGCYFAATGMRQDRQAFVQGMFQKLGEEQEYVEWSGRVLRSNRRLSILSFFGFVISIALMASLSSLVIWKLLEN